MPSGRRGNENRRRSTGVSREPYELYGGRAEDKRAFAAGSINPGKELSAGSFDRLAYLVGRKLTPPTRSVEPPPPNPARSSGSTDRSTSAHFAVWWIRRERAGQTPRLALLGFLSARILIGELTLQFFFFFPLGILYLKLNKKRRKQSRAAFPAQPPTLDENVFRKFLLTSDSFISTTFIGTKARNSLAVGTYAESAWTRPKSRRRQSKRENHTSHG